MTQAIQRLTQQRLNLLVATQITLKNALNLVGVSKTRTNVVAHPSVSVYYISITRRSWHVVK
ncbi:hypothetical protein MGH68_19065 [Erysipelothrix sp. D19-032]